MAAGRWLFGRNDEVGRIDGHERVWHRVRGGMPDVHDALSHDGSRGCRRNEQHPVLCEHDERHLELRCVRHGVSCRFAVLERRMCGVVHDRPDRVLGRVREHSERPRELRCVRFRVRERATVRQRRVPRRMPRGAVAVHRALH